MAIVAKMVCNKNETSFAGYEDSTEQAEPTVLLQEQVRLDAVYSDDPENPNHQWSKWTPSGQLDLLITNPDAQRYLQPGVEYIVEIRKYQPTKAREAVRPPDPPDQQGTRVG